MKNEDKFDKYGNEIDGEFLYCSFPDCGCDGARLCMAKNGASDLSNSCNVEGMWSHGSDPKCANAVFGLLSYLNKK